MLAVWQPLQTDHESGSMYSDMQKAEKRMAERWGIKVHPFEFKEAEVSEMNTKGEIVGDKCDETAFKQRLEVFLLEHAWDRPRYRGRL